MKIALPPARRRNLVSITPLIDVVFILLFFFMLASSLDRQQAILLRLTGAPAPGDQPVESRTLQVRPGPQVEWQGAWLELSALIPRLDEVGLDRVLILQPAPGASIQDLVRVLETLRSAGHSRVSLAIAP